MSSSKKAHFIEENCHFIDDYFDLDPLTLNARSTMFTASSRKRIPKNEVIMRSIDNSGVSTICPKH